MYCLYFLPSGTVCNLLNFFSCMRGSPKTKLHHQIHPGRPGHFDAVIVWKGKGDDQM